MASPPIDERLRVNLSEMDRDFARADARAKALEQRSRLALAHASAAAERTRASLARTEQVSAFALRRVGRFAALEVSGELLRDVNLGQPLEDVANAGLRIGTAFAVGGPVLGSIATLFVLYRALEGEQKKQEAAWAAMKKRVSDAETSLNKKLIALERKRYEQKIQDDEAAVKLATATKTEMEELNYQTGLSQRPGD